MTRTKPPNCLLSNPLLSSSLNSDYGIQKLFMHTNLVYFVLSKQVEHISSSSSRHFVPKDQNKLCTHDKNSKRVELRVKINIFNVFVMYALDSAHVKVRRFSESKWIFCRAIREARSNRTAGRPKYISIEPNWLKRRTLHVPNLIIWFDPGLRNRKTEEKNSSKPAKPHLKSPETENYLQNPKTYKIVISGAFKAKYTDDYFIKVLVNVRDLSEAFVSLSTFFLLQTSLFPFHFQCKSVILSKF